MSTIKGYTYIPKNDNNSFHCHIWDELQKGALSNCGNAFSFEIHLITEERSFHTERSLFGSGQKWVCGITHRYDSLNKFKKAFHFYTPKLSVSLRETCFSDTRTTLHKDTKAYVAEAKYGYVATIDVPRAYSQEIYMTYSLEAVSFCNRLLSQHKQLLIQMSKGLIKVEPTYATKDCILGDIFVSPIGIYNEYYDRDNPHYLHKFADFGMSSLMTVQQCYGFVLALMELYQPRWEEFAIPKLEVSVIHSENQTCVKDEFIAIKLHYYVPKETTVLQLNSW